MEEIVVTRLWMAGVVGMMLIFAAIAVVGHFRQKSTKNNNPGQESTGG